MPGSRSERATLRACRGAWTHHDRPSRSPRQARATLASTVLLVSRPNARAKWPSTATLPPSVSASRGWTTGPPPLSADERRERRLIERLALMDADLFEDGVDTDQAAALTLRWIVVDGDARLYAVHIAVQHVGAQNCAHMIARHLLSSSLRACSVASGGFVMRRSLDITRHSPKGLQDRCYGGSFGTRTLRPGPGPRRK